MPTGGEETRIQLTIGRKPGPCACGAKRLCNGRDDTDLTAAVAIAPTFRHFSGVVGIDRFKRHFAAYGGDHFCRGHDFVHAPAIGVAHVHEFDEAHDVAGAFEVPRHVDDAAGADAALDHHVDFD